MNYIRPFDPATGTPSVDAAWTNGDPGTGTEGSIPPAEFYANTLAELCHVIDHFLGDGSWNSGQNAADLTQLRKAIEAAVGTDQVLHVVDEKPEGTTGGGAPTGAWNVRALNTVNHNSIAGASLASNRITLPAGGYDILAAVPAFDCDRYKTRLYDTTAAATVLTGTPEWAHNDFSHATRSFIIGRFTLAATSDLEVQMRHTTNTNAFGLPASFGEPEIYTIASIRKVA